MDNLRIIFWVVVGIIYVVSKLRNNQQKPQSPPKESIPPQKGISFEELLQEIQRTKKVAPPMQPAQSLARAVEPEKERKPLEQVDYSHRDHDTIYETYEKAKQQAFLRPSMEETLKLENTQVRFGEFKNYSLDHSPKAAAVYAQELRNAESVKKAFLLGEILNRKF